jgi:hypothetical protein
MADFCKQCSEELFGKDFGDLKGLISEEEVKKGFGAVVICESCGYTLVDHEGRCVASDCTIHGKGK